MGQNLISNMMKGSVRFSQSLPAIILSLVALFNVACSDMMNAPINYGHLLAFIGVDARVIIPKNAVGATTSTTLRSLDFTPSNSNAIFVAETGSDENGNGTMTNPFLTINKAITECDATRNAVVIMDSGFYRERAFEMKNDFRGFYSLPGNIPVISFIPVAEMCDINDIKEIISPTPFTASSPSLYQRSICRLQNGNVVIAYVVSSYQIRFVIVDQEGNVVISEKTVNTGSANILMHYSPAVTALRNGNWVLCYANTGNYYQAFQIFDCNGEQVVSETFLKEGVASSSLQMACTALENGSFVVSYNEYCSSESTYYIHYKIFNESGSIVRDESQIYASSSNNGEKLMCTLSNGNWIVVWTSNSPSMTRFSIWDPDGNSVVPTSILDSDSRMSGFGGITALGNEKWVVISTRCDVAGWPLAYTIRNNDGTEVKGHTTVEASSGYGVPIALANSSWWICVYIRNELSQLKGKFTVYDENGTKIVGPLYFYNGSISNAGFSASLLNNGNVMMGSLNNLSVWYPYSWTGITVTADSIIDGLLFDSVNNGGMKRLIDVDTVRLELKYCDIKSCIKPSNDLLSGYSVYTNNELLIQNCKFYNNDNGIYSEANSLIIRDSQLFGHDGYALHINGAAASPGDITINHCDFYNNGGGVRIQNNNGANEVIKNSIFHGNAGYGIDADSVITVRRSIVSDTVQNAIFGEGTVDLDPLYVNEGDPGPDYLDLHLQSLFCGYTADSPAIGLADDGRNSGAYDVDYR